MRNDEAAHLNLAMESTKWSRDEHCPVDVMVHAAELSHIDVAILANYRQKMVKTFDGAIVVEAAAVAVEFQARTDSFPHSTGDTVP